MDVPDLPFKSARKRTKKQQRGQTPGCVACDNESQPSLHARVGIGGFLQHAHVGIGGLVLVVVDDFEVATRHGSRAVSSLLRARWSSLLLLGARAALPHFERGWTLTGTRVERCMVKVPTSDSSTAVPNLTGRAADAKGSPGLGQVGLIVARCLFVTRSATSFTTSAQFLADISTESLEFVEAP